MQEIIVIGGGVVGLTSAWWLLEAGHKVTLLERAPQVGTGTSFSNGGQLSYRYVSPLADVGVPLKALQWMFQEYGPLRFKPQVDLHQWTWLASFLANCRADANRKTTNKLLQLGELSRRAMVQLEPVVPPASFQWRESGKLVVYRTRKAFEAATSKMESSGTTQVWSAADCVAHEPALAAVEDKLEGGIYNGGEAVADCYAFCVSLAERIAAHPRFNGFLHADAQSFVTAGDKITGLQTSTGLVKADAYVLAAGMQSRALGKSAGISLPIYPLKGYSLTAPIRPEDVAPEISVTDFERKVLYARIGGNLRVAAMVDMMGEDLSLDARRLASLTRQVRETMPNAADYNNVIPWAGLRPATPNSAPIVGRSPYSNLWLNIGHGPLGFTFACGTATVLADLVQGKAHPSRSKA
ncbi:D-amino acid dehydrogenase [Massilia sp. Bi118]|uniref:D-amino acid dehydrogenase n=1 Tax=Massilia sp. Bi118 TaxID=2822346 RepID=UPI001D670B52|nr:D-amino acid dehydrogenase [Massilia sp. Bi118]CAH0249735.1 D-amino acid dehydrogenase [Massilia sp. Bi118]